MQLSFGWALRCSENPPFFLQPGFHKNRDGNLRAFCCGLTSGYQTTGSNEQSNVPHGNLRSRMMAHLHTH
jgi:hypothetical protein